MEASALTALSPVDGRYAATVAPLREYFSEAALIRERIRVEALWFLQLSDATTSTGTLPDAVYTFKHALVQEAAYGTLLRERRQQLHGRIAAALEQQFPEIAETQPEQLARHCAEAGFVEKAVGYCLKAGQQAYGLAVGGGAIYWLNGDNTIDGIAAP